MDDISDCLAAVLSVAVISLMCTVDIHWGQWFAKLLLFYGCLELLVLLISSCNTSHSVVFQFQYGFVAWLLSTCVGLLLSFLRYSTAFPGRYSQINALSLIQVDHNFAIGDLGRPSVGPGFQFRVVLLACVLLVQFWSVLCYICLYQQGWCFSLSVYVLLEP